MDSDVLKIIMNRFDRLEAKIDQVLPIKYQVYTVCALLGVFLPLFVAWILR